MKRLPIIPAMAAFALLVVFPRNAWAWGCEGHQIVALIAEKHVRPEVLSAVNALLTENPVDPALKPYCKGTGDAMADAATWADDYRNVRLDTAGWHFIDIPLESTEATAYQYCWQPDGCITAAIADQLKILRSAEANPRERAMALRFLIHFLGDLHQPLHAADNNDRGGNCVPVAFFDRKPQLTDRQQGSYSPNLHSIWDTDILRRVMDPDLLAKDPAKAVRGFAGKLDGEFASQGASWMGHAEDFERWAWESHQLAVQVAYGKLPRSIPAESWKTVSSCSDDNFISGRMLELDEQLGQPYQDAATPVVEEQLAKAGLRLAGVLNYAWPEKSSRN